MNLHRYAIILFNSLALILVVMFLSIAQPIISLGAPPLQATLTPTVFVYLPYVVKDASVSTPNPTTTPTPTATPTTPLHFPLDYGPYRLGQQPDGPTPSPAEIKEDITIIKQETNLIRTYGACDDELALIPGLADAHNINVYQGAWLDTTPSLNDQEITCFIKLVTEHENIVAGVIGNEALLFGTVSEADLINYLNQVKEAVDVPITTAETWGTWCKETNAKPRCQGLPNLSQTVDFILSHHHPYWEALPIEHGAAHVVATYLALRAVYPDQDIIIGETGWPTCGNPFGNAIPSLENQRRFIEELWSWANLYDIPILYFEIFDEPYKSEGSTEVGDCWGLYDANRIPKHNNLNWTTPTPEATPTTTPAIRIEHPRNITTMMTKPNCAIPIFGRIYNAEPGWEVRVEVFTNQWYIQDKWYPNGLAPIVNNMWGMPEIFLAGQGQYNNHAIRATLVNEVGEPVASDQITGIMRTNSCSP